MRQIIGSLLVAVLLVASAAAERPEPTVTPGKIAKHASDFYGRHVRVQGAIESALGPQVFTLDEDEALAGPDLLVLVPHAMYRALAEGQVVVVTGVVRRWSEPELERDFDFFEAGDLVRMHGSVDWTTRPVLVAMTVMGADGGPVEPGAEAPPVP